MNKPLFAAISMLALALPRAAAAQGCPVQIGDFTRTKVVGNEMNEPMEMEIDHEDNVWWTERKTGFLQVFDAKARTVIKSATIKTYMNGTGVAQSNSVGLIGIALAPDFAASRKLYLNYSPEPVGGKQKLRVSRYTVGANKILDPGSEELIMEWDASFTCCHQGGSLEFGPDGVLYIGTGDNWNTDASDPASWAVPYSVSMNPQNHNGKILRIRPNPAGPGYTVPSGNLFPAAGDGKPEIYVMGSRNSYRIQADPRTGWLYWGDIGPDGPRMEEFNQTRNEPGNYGWPAFIGDNEPTPGNSGWAPIQAQRPPLKVPLISFNGTTDKVHTGATTTVGMNIRGRAGWAGPVYYYPNRSASKNKFPPSFHGTLTVYDWHMAWIKTVRFNDEGYVKSVDAFASFPWVHMIDMKFSPSGELYVLDYGATYRQNNSDDGLWKITYNPSDAAACLPSVPELDNKTIANARPVGVGPGDRRGGRNAEALAFVRLQGGLAFVDLVALEGGRAVTGALVIRDLSGREVHRRDLRAATGTIALPALPAGLYGVEIRTAASVRGQKVLLSPL